MPTTTAPTSSVGVARRLRPLYAAAFLQNVTLWVPVEKLFMTSIGFTTATIGVMAALYALVVPLLEVPSGILADRWSRRGVLIVALVALAASVTVGGLSPDVGWYFVAAALLGVYFAMDSGTYESMFYDVLVEETGDSALFEQAIGRLRLVQSVALVLSALAGGVLAQVASLRATYFLTLPFLLASAAAVWVFREPALHRREAPEPLRSQIKATYRTLLQPGALRAIVALTVLAAVLLQAVFEFGPVWLVALAVPAVLYGPQWSGLTLALGAGGALGSRAWLGRRGVLVAAACLLVGACVVFSVSHDAALVIAAQILVIGVLAAVGVPLTRRLHDAIPSTLRAGVTSGTSTLSWLVFLPLSLAFGFTSERAGVHAAGWILVGVAVAAAVLVVTSLRAQSAPPTFPPERFLPADDPAWPGHWARPPAEWAALDEHALDEARAAIRDLPPDEQRAIVLRDVDGRTTAEAARALGVDEATARSLVHRARAAVRARLAARYGGRDA